MARKAPLRSVGAGETAPEPAPEKRPTATVMQAVEEGTRRDELVSLRKRIAKAIDDPNIRGADLAALSRRLLEIGKEIDAIDAAALEEDSSDATPDEDWDESAI